jgi:transposase-like protein
MKETYELEEQNDLRILDMYNEGLKPTSIAAVLRIPLINVYEVIEQNFDFSNPEIVQYDEDEL